MPPLPQDAQVLDGILYRYHFIGKGAQFRVYGVYTLDGRPTNRVIKIPLDFFETKQAIIEPLRLLGKHRSEDELDELADRRAREIMTLKYDVPNLLQGIRGKDRHFMQQLGKLRMLQTPIPVSEDSATYYLPTLLTQDYVMTLDDYLQAFRLASFSYARTLEYETIQTLKTVIDQMIQLHFTIWEYGIFEFVFKPENFGIKKTSLGKIELVWMDLAEHITDLSQAEQIITEKRWLHPMMSHKIDYQFMPLILQKYYAEACNKAFTVENLRRKWRKKCITAEKRQVRHLRLKELVEQDAQKKVTYWVARHNLSESLYLGFPEPTIDDMRIPIPDITRLLADKRLTDPTAPYPEEKLERTMIKARVGGIIPLIISPNFLSKEKSS